MTQKHVTLWIAACALSLAGAGCASDAFAEPAGASLQAASAAGNAAADRDHDVDENVDEANDTDDDIDEQVDEAPDADLTIDQLPAAARTAVETQVGTGSITSIDRDQGRSGVKFEIDYTNANGERWELDVAEDGTVLQSERD